MLITMHTHHHAGTAGLRGKMGPGFNRMNDVTVQQTSQGLCRYLQQNSPKALNSNGIVIGVWVSAATLLMMILPPLRYVC